jgi:ABC-type spermidine/putrescine transport system permease subunit II
MFAFLLSWDELLVAFFNLGADNTLPTFIWASLRHSITYETLALGTLLSMATAVLVVLVWLSMSRKSRRKRAIQQPR